MDQGGGQKVTHDIKLPRGVLIRGKVDRARDWQPLAGSSIQFFPIPARRDVLDGWQAIVASGRRRLVPDRRSRRQGAPARLRTDLRLHSRGDRRRHALAAVKPGGMPILCPRHHPLRGQGRQRTPRRQCRAAAWQDDQGPRVRPRRPDGASTPRSSRRSTSSRSTPPGAATPRFPSATAASRSTVSTPSKAYRVYVLDAEHEWGAAVDTLRQAGRRGAHGPAPALRPGRGAVRRARRQAARRSTSPTSSSWRRPARPCKPDERSKAELSADADFMANVDRKHY